MINVKRTVEVYTDLSWETLKQASNEGKLNRIIQSGDTLDITLKNGEVCHIKAYALRGEEADNAT